MARKKIAEVKSVFNSARQFEEAADILFFGATHHPMTVVDRNRFVQFPGNVFDPMVVSASFAIELYFKCLHIIDHGGYEWGHKLKDQFDGLTDATRDRVRKYWSRFCATYAPPPHIQAQMAQVAKEQYGVSDCVRGGDLDTALAIANESFQEWRYAFEHAGTKQLTWSLGPLVPATRLAVVELEPSVETK